MSSRVLGRLLLGSLISFIWGLKKRKIGRSSWALLLPHPPHLLELLCFERELNPTWENGIDARRDRRLQGGFLGLRQGPQRYHRRVGGEAGKMFIGQVWAVVCDDAFLVCSNYSPPRLCSLDAPTTRWPEWLRIKYIRIQFSDAHCAPTYLVAI